MSNTYFKNKGFSQSFIYDSQNKQHPTNFNQVNWDSNFNGDIGNLSLDINKNGNIQHSNLKLDKNNFYNNQFWDKILNPKTDTLSIDKRLQHDFNTRPPLLPLPLSYMNKSNYQTKNKTNKKYLTKYKSYSNLNNISKSKSKSKSKPNNISKSNSKYLTIQ